MPHKRGARPARGFKMGPVTRVAWWCAVAGAPLAVGLALIRYPEMPETTATHFDLAGRPDAWGPKWVLLLLIVVVAALAESIAWLARHPQWFNYPVRFPAANQGAVYREGERTMVWMNLGVLAVLFAAALQFWGVPITPAVFVGLGIMLAAAAAGTIRTVRAARRLPTPGR